MKRYLIAGLVVWVPIAVITFIVKFIFGLLDSSMQLLPPQYQPEVLFGYNVPGFSLIILLLVLIVTGFFASNWLGKRLINFSEKILDKIPLLRSIYKAVKQSMTVVFSNKSSSFREVVLLEYPRKGIWSIGFKTSNHNSINKDLVMVFIPTTPNPTSGFLVMVPDKDLKKLDIKIDEALKMIITLGTAQSGELVE